MTNETEPRRSWSRDPWVVLGIVLHLSLLTALWWNHARVTRSDLRITPLDSIARPGDTAELHAIFELDDFSPIDRRPADLDVHFSFGRLSLLDPDAHDHSHGHSGHDHAGHDHSGHDHAHEPKTPIDPAMRVQTDGNGVARVSVAVPNPIATDSGGDDGTLVSGPNPFDVRPVEEAMFHLLPPRNARARRQASLWVWPEETPLVVIDADTALSVDGWASLEHAIPVARERMAVGLFALAQSHRLIYSTEVETKLLPRLRTWLLTTPSGPLVSWEKNAVAQQLADLEGRYSRVEYGVTGSHEGCAAFQSAGIPHATFGEQGCPSGGSECTPVRSWDELSDHFRRRRASAPRSSDKKTTKTPGG